MRNEIAKGLETSPPETINKEISDNQSDSMDKTIEFWHTLGAILKFDPLDNRDEEKLLQGDFLPNDIFQVDDKIYYTNENGRIVDSQSVEGGLKNSEKELIKGETGWSNEIIDNIENIKQYEILKNAGLIEVEINGRKCLIKENIDLDYTDDDGISNRDRIERGKAPLDSDTGKPIELHHLGQKANSPLVELTEEEHRTGEYEDGKKNQSLWHDNTKGTEVHGENESNWKQERENHWKSRAEYYKE